MSDNFERDRHLHMMIQRKYNLVSAWEKAIRAGWYRAGARETALRYLKEAVQDYNELYNGLEGVFWMESIPAKVGQLLSELQ